MDLKWKWQEDYLLIFFDLLSFGDDTVTVSQMFLLITAFTISEFVNEQLKEKLEKLSESLYDDVQNTEDFGRSFTKIIGLLEDYQAQENSAKKPLALIISNVDIFIARNQSMTYDDCRMFQSWLTFLCVFFKERNYKAFIELSAGIVLSKDLCENIGCEISIKDQICLDSFYFDYNEIRSLDKNANLDYQFSLWGGYKPKGIEKNYFHSCIFYTHDIMQTNDVFRYFIWALSSPAVTDLVESLKAGLIVDLKEDLTLPFTLDEVFCLKQDGCAGDNNVCAVFCKMLYRIGFVQLYKHNGSLVYMSNQIFQSSIVYFFNHQRLLVEQKAADGVV